MPEKVSHKWDDSSHCALLSCIIEVTNLDRDAFTRVTEGMRARGYNTTYSGVRYANLVPLHFGESISLPALTCTFP